MATTRRSLLGKLAASPLLLPFARRTAEAQAREAAPTPVPAASPTPSDQKPSLLQQLARERYGKFLTEEQGKELDERIASLERTGARLRGLKLGNGDEPATDFAAARWR